MRLYPPYIEGTIPAFYDDPAEDYLTITIPFSMNRSVSINEVEGFDLKIKTAQSNNTIVILTQTDVAWYKLESDCSVTFCIDREDQSTLYNRFQVGQYYKVQLAYRNESGTGFYSSVGIIKYTTKPKVYIDNMYSYANNSHKYTYTGIYQQYKEDSRGFNINDTTEKVYSYQFILTDANNNIIDDTGIKIHNVDTNVESYESIDKYTYSSDISVNNPYFLQYIVYTNNKLTVASPQYKIIQQKSIPPYIDAELKAELNYDNGYISLYLVGNKNEFGKETVTTGAFTVSRACSSDNFQTWHEVFKFSLYAEQPSHFLFKDFTVEQGKEYVYGLRQYNDYGLQSSRLLSNVIMADFEDIFLYDGERQLKIRFNPKVSSFKTTLLESKVDTIGSKHPFIFRNGKVGYKEFPIGGLISYHSDEDQLFMTNEELGLEDDLKRTKTINYKINDYTKDDLKRLYNKGGVYRKLQEKIEGFQEERQILDNKIANTKIRTTEAVDYNISAEREFKLTVLDWLNNGKLKLFRSPGEGNYIVRLMNVSLTPEDKTGRMIHNFSATAYEMDNYTYDNLIKHKLTDVYQEVYTTRYFESLPLSFPTETQDEFEKTLKRDSRYQRVDDIYYLRGEVLTKHNPAISVTIEDYNAGDSYLIEIKNKGSQEIIIGNTGFYQLDIQEEITSIKLPVDAQYTGVIHYEYLTESTTVFNDVRSIAFKDYLGKQFIGRYNNVIDAFTNIKDLFSKFYYLRFRKREIEPYPINDGLMINPLSLYKQEVQTINVKISTKTTSVPVEGYDVVSTSIVNKNLVQGKISNRYYYIDRQKYVSAEGLDIDPNITYFEKINFEIYYDKNRPGVLIVPESTYDLMQKYFVNTTGNNVIFTNVEIYSCVIEIDEAPLDLTDVKFFDINEECEFDIIKLSNGTYLECGYQIQEVYFSIEDIIPADDPAKNNYHIYNYYLSDDYYDEVLQNTITETVYNQNVNLARTNYDSAKQAYIEVVEEYLRGGNQS